MSKVDLKPFEGMLLEAYVSSGYQVYASFPSEQLIPLRGEIAKKMSGLGIMANSFKVEGDKTLFAASFNDKVKAETFYQSMKTTKGISAFTDYKR